MQRPRRRVLSSGLRGRTAAAAYASLERVEGQPALVGNHQFAVQDQFLP
ncbi:hypothetical protein [Streptomyces sp. WAC 06738]|nr:hypothetical protein [Streptomyces sp. WAC 06738]